MTDLQNLQGESPQYVTTIDASSTIKSVSVTQDIVSNVTNLWSTSDLYLTAYLKTKGFKYQVTKLKSKSNFSLVSTPELLLHVHDYLSEKGLCDPLAYSNAIKNLKNYLYNNK